MEDLVEWWALLVGNCEFPVSKSQNFVYRVDKQICRNFYNCSFIILKFKLCRQRCIMASLTHHGSIAAIALAQVPNLGKNKH